MPYGIAGHAVSGAANAAESFDSVSVAAELTRLGRAVVVWRRRGTAATAAAANVAKRFESVSRRSELTRLCRAVLLPRTGEAIRGHMLSHRSGGRVEYGLRCEFVKHNRFHRPRAKAILLTLWHAG